MRAKRERTIDQAQRTNENSTLSDGVLFWKKESVNRSFSVEKGGSIVSSWKGQEQLLRSVELAEQLCSVVFDGRIKLSVASVSKGQRDRCGAPCHGRDRLVKARSASRFCFFSVYVQVRAVPLTSRSPFPSPFPFPLLLTQHRRVSVFRFSSLPFIRAICGNFLTRASPVLHVFRPLKSPRYRYPIRHRTTSRSTRTFVRDLIARSRDYFREIDYFQDRKLACKKPYNLRE